MANSLTAIMPKILARGLLAFRELAVLPRLVNSDFSSEAKAKGNTIDVPVSSAIAVRDVVPSVTPPPNQDGAPTTVQIALNKWKEATFNLTDSEMTQIDEKADFLPMAINEAVRALANQVNSDIHAEYKGIYGYTGTAGTTPFATDVTGATNLRKTLNQQRAPKPSRGAVLDFDAEANALALPQFSDAEKTGETSVKIEGEIGRKFGFNWVADDNVRTHVAGTLTGAIVTSGAAALGAKALVLATDAAEAVALLTGDIVTFAGDGQTYVVTADATIGASTTGPLAIEPGLKVAQAGGEVISVKASHVVNLGFHREAFAFAARPLVQSTKELELGNRIVSMVDPQTGIPLRLEISRQHKQVTWAFDILYGAKLVRPEGAARLAG